MQKPTLLLSRMQPNVSPFNDRNKCADSSVEAEEQNTMGEPMMFNLNSPKQIT